MAATISSFGEKAFTVTSSKLVAVSLRTRKNSTELGWEQDWAPQVSNGKPGPVNHWPESSGVTLRQHHKRNTGNTVSAGVVGSHTGIVCKSPVTFMDGQLDTEPTYGSVQGKKKVENGNEQKDKLERNRKLNNRAMSKHRSKTSKRKTNVCNEQKARRIHVERLGNNANPIISMDYKA